MNEEKRTVEGEMGLGDSDDEFYNVKLPCTPSVPACVATEKPEIKKIYSPSRTKVTYNYNFDSSSDDESEIVNGWKHNEKKNESNISNNIKDEKLLGNDEEKKSSKPMFNLPQNTYKVVEKINEELRNAKKHIKTINEKQDNSTGRQSYITNPIQTSGNITRPHLGVISPMVMVRPPMLVPQAPVMNINQMMVPSANLIPRHMVGINGNLVRASAPIGGIMANPSNTIPTAMMAMNTVQNQMSGLIGVQNSIIGLTGSGMGLQANMEMQKNILRMATATGNGMFNMQQASGNMVASQNASAPGNLIGMTGPMRITSDTMIRNQNLKSSGGLFVNPGCVKNNPSGTMVIGDAMNIYEAAESSDSTQTTAVVDTINVTPSSNVKSKDGTPQGNPTVRQMPPPPPFLSVKSVSTTAGIFKWPSNVQNPDIIKNSAEGSAALQSSGSRDSPFDSNKSSNSNDINEPNSENKEKLQTNALSNLEACESQSPSHSFNPSRDLSNTFKNDGSFMEMFKKMKSEKNLETSNNAEGSESKEKSNTSIKTPPVILSGMVGKRRGGRVLKTGLVKKVKKEGDTDEEKRPKDAWSMYMAEVKKYREASCEEEGKTRPLVK